ncbi:MAG TPA: hypothetical protein VIZ67_04775 [Acidimicrobiales bacterium]
MRWSHGHHAATTDDVRTQLRSEPAGESELLAALGTHDEKPGREVFEEPPSLERWDRVQSRWNLGSVLVLLPGAALVVLGAAALARTEIDRTWFSPVEEVAGIRHTPLLAVIEAGVGLLLVIAGLAGAPGMAAFVCISAAMAAGVAALEPGLVSEQLAAERWWLIVLAVAGGGLAVLSMVPWPHFVERRYTSEVATARRRRSAARPGLVS